MMFGAHLAGGGPRTYQGDIGERILPNISRVFMPTHSLHAEQTLSNSGKMVPKILRTNQKGIYGLTLRKLLNDTM